MAERPLLWVEYQVPITNSESTWKLCRDSWDFVRLSDAIGFAKKVFVHWRVTEGEGGQVIASSADLVAG